MIIYLIFNGSTHSNTFTSIISHTYLNTSIIKHSVCSDHMEHNKPTKEEDFPEPIFYNTQEQREK